MKVKIYSHAECEFEAAIVDQDDRVENDCIQVPCSWIYGY